MTGLHEECGVFGVYAPHTTDVAAMTYAALYALQHRGQESCGIVVNDRGVFSHHKDLGLVPEVFKADDMEKLGHGNISIGHVRYSTTGKPNRANAQPIVVRHVKGPMSIAHNGNLTNARELRERYELKGAIFHTTNDTEVISYAITEQRLKRASIEEAVEYAMQDLKGAYSLVVMSPKKLIAARDPHGFRPLCMGRCKDGSVVFASESCALDSVGATFERDIDPGEIVIVDDSQVRSIRTHCGEKHTMCVFEYIYFARLNAGKILWQEHPVDADVVVGVPDSGLDAALGLSIASGIPYGVGFVKNRYVGRTFIQPSQKMRTDSVRIKLNVLKSVVKGKRVILVDDSIVRGTTCKRIVNLLREAGAKEVHMRISCPPFTHPCYFGVDIDSQENLIACQMTVPEICKYIGADTLGYLSLKGVKSLTSPDLQEQDWFCTGCFSGTYPIAVPKEMPKDKFENKIGE
jgi:amidophosphoribosyltransferase